MSALALELRQVHKSFGRTPIINGVDLAITKGERHAIIGPNGAGKSTLFNLISGRFPPSSGQILLDGEEITGLDAQDINRRGLARSFQITNIFPRLSVYENVRCALLWSRGYRYSFWQRVGALEDVRARAEEIVSKIGLTARRDRPAGVLSYAEQRAQNILVVNCGHLIVGLGLGPSPQKSVGQSKRVRKLVIKDHRIRYGNGWASAKLRNLDALAVAISGVVDDVDTSSRIVR
jgi:branched-chain amino acid transport system ATP-binding protein